MRRPSEDQQGPDSLLLLRVMRLGLERGLGASQSSGLPEVERIMATPEFLGFCTALKLLPR